MKKNRFDPVNYIPNQSKYQRGFFNEAFKAELRGKSECAKRQEQLAKNKR